MNESATASVPSAPVDPADRWQAWDRFLEATPATGFMQSSWWAAFRTDAGYRHFGAVVKQHEQILGGALVLAFSYGSDGCFYYMPEGPVLPADDATAGEVFETVLDAVEVQRRSEHETVSHLRIEPRWETMPSFVSGFEPVAEFVDAFVEPRRTLCIDLRPSETDLLAQMHPKGRYNIRLAQRHGISVAEDTSDEGLADFCRIYDDTAGRQGFGAKPWDYFASLIPLLRSRERGSVFFAEYRGTRIAAAVVVHLGSRTTYFFGGSLATHRPLMAPYLLHFEIMRRAKALGSEWYDLWGVAPPDQPDHGWAGISAFKRKFGGVDVRLVPTMDYVYDREAYARYRATKGGRGTRD